MGRGCICAGRRITAARGRSHRDGKRTCARAHQHSVGNFGVVHAGLRMAASGAHPRTTRNGARRARDRGTRSVGIAVQSIRHIQRVKLSHSDGQPIYGKCGCVDFDCLLVSERFVSGAAVAQTLVFTSRRAGVCAGVGWCRSVRVARSRARYRSSPNGRVHQIVDGLATRNRTLGCRRTSGGSERGASRNRVSSRIAVVVGTTHCVWRGYAGAAVLERRWWLARLVSGLVDRFDRIFGFGATRPRFNCGCSNRCRLRRGDTHMGPDRARAHESRGHGCWQIAV